MLYRIINPSDEYTFTADTDHVAALVGLILGKGKYWIERITGGPEGAGHLGAEMVLPLMLLGANTDALDALDTLDIDINRLSEHIEESSDDLIEAFKTVAIVGPEERLNYEAKLVEADDPEAFAATWHDARRSSLNDIRTRALDAAKALMESAEEGTVD